MISIQQNIVACPTYSETFIGGKVTSFSRHFPGLFLWKQRVLWTCSIYTLYRPTLFIL